MMSHFEESIEIAAPSQTIWDYVQDYRRRAEWDKTVTSFEPIGTDRVGKGVAVRVKSAGPPPFEYEALYVSFEPYKVSAVKQTRPITNVPFARSAGSWRYQDLGNGRTRFSMTFEYEPKWGLLGRLLDTLLMRSAIRRSVRDSLTNLQRAIDGK
jgi:uncharacterized membrane protein